MRVLFDSGPAKYVCDWCRRNLSAESYPHVSLVVGERSGVAQPHVPGWPGWRFTLELRPRRVHFCLPEGEGRSCMDQWAQAVTNAEGVTAVEYRR